MKTRAGPALLLGLLPFALGARCAWSAAGQTGCQPMADPRPLPPELRESSGVTFGFLHPQVLWSHNDSGHPPVLVAMDGEGTLLGVFPLSPEAGNRDWEDIAAGPCGGGGCLYVADTGDNMEVRPGIVLLRIREPSTFDSGQVLPAERFVARLPQGPRDIESVFVLPDEQVFFITKGRNHPVTVYRYPPPLRPEVEVVLEEVQLLTEGPQTLPSQVTGADASRDGRYVVVRTYTSLTFYRSTGGRLTPIQGGKVDLRTLEEPQGEGVALGEQGRVALTTEGGNFGGIAALRLLRCRMTEGRSGGGDRPFGEPQLQGSK